MAHRVVSRQPGRPPTPRHVRARSAAAASLWARPGATWLVGPSAREAIARFGLSNSGTTRHDVFGFCVNAQTRTERRGSQKCGSARHSAPWCSMGLSLLWYTWVGATDASRRATSHIGGCGRMSNPCAVALGQVPASSRNEMLIRRAEARGVEERCGCLETTRGNRALPCTVQRGGVNPVCSSEQQRIRVRCTPEILYA